MKVSSLAFVKDEEVDSTIYHGTTGLLTVSSVQGFLTLEVVPINHDRRHAEGLRQTIRPKDEANQLHDF